MGAPGKGWRARSTMSGPMRRRCQCEAAVARCARRSAASASVRSPTAAARSRYSVTLDQREIRSDDQVRGRKRLPHSKPSCLIEQPCEHCTRLGVETHRLPRSSSRSCAAVRFRRRLRGRGGYVPSSPGWPSETRPRRANATRPAGTEVSTDLRPGDVSSATTSPRSVTRTLSPDRTSRRYSLSRFFSSRTPTVFTFSM